MVKIKPSVMTFRLFARQLFTESLRKSDVDYSYYGQQLLLLICMFTFTFLNRPQQHWTVDPIIMAIPQCWHLRISHIDRMSLIQRQQNPDDTIRNYIHAMSHHIKLCILYFSNCIVLVLFLGCPVWPCFCSGQYYILFKQRILSFQLLKGWGHYLTMDT